MTDFKLLLQRVTILIIYNDNIENLELLWSNMVVTGITESCPFDNLKCHLLQQS